MKGGRGDQHPPYQGGQGGSTPPLSRVGLIHESTVPYQGGEGVSNLKSIFNLIITSYLLR
ncbi:MAG: hypothetical protein EWV64_10025 [Microcystis flos-aquae Ma_QC_C_20070823_S18]|uniref:Uncharacterized protein n=1 Tax=Microcystis flos-aquae Mf_QC_C_20070823_S10D TaxID=2486236 RepID=A0A552L511_9CHRO|nr:MAG: hypothetical protein EWV64_10025 [Microcystis flos-aquae Ma_QC_C_20070823_S18]TRT97791.1 MAG: hypothetical protein EWV65_11145 [Microcystis flos-aquae Ma_QC_C_20070823_S18D]TRV15325.1 MAG: hypothetical protein EWV45_03405 [Microcystis flos-aquae Mf_QC_C_20070823_S10D]TRV21657.1 MAG: hypothetical protein EWV72_17170 [Microcystis flos-aquae Mf_QC_C_20070823_S10]TRV33417.1 MAG: hypothetical protein EWV71_16460 [Microcystis flos-aquae Mf_QC_C_20070823_S20D]TRV35022.1 MAG: hypothetical prot